MGLLLSILFSYVGAIELMFIFRDIVHRVGLHHERMILNRTLSKTTSPSPLTLLDLQKNLRKSIKSSQEQSCETDCIQSMADGVQYDQGYRVPSPDEPDTSKRWLEARASITMEPRLLKSESFEKNSEFENTAVASDNQYDEVSNNDSLGSSDLSIETIIENRKKNYQTESEDPSKGDEVPVIYFEEYSQDRIHTLDDNTKKTQRKHEESQRRKSYKTFTAGQSSNITPQRRRSEDIDGETDNPWGELKPESFHDNNLWARERAMSIAENEGIISFVEKKSYCENFDLNNNQPISKDKQGFSENMNENANKANGEHESDVSNEYTFISNDSSEEILGYDCTSVETLRNMPEIFVVLDGTDIEEIVEKNKMSEFIDYIEHIDDENTSRTSNLQSNKCFEQSKRKRYPSRNYEFDKNDEDELKDCLIVERDECVLNDLANIDNSEYSYSQQTINNCTPNIFALTTINQLDSDENIGQYAQRPIIRITSTEDERIEQFLHENCDQMNSEENHCQAEMLIKSKTTQMFDYSEVNMIDVESFESDSRDNSPISNATRRDSLFSDAIQFECKQSTNSHYLYNREDSSSSNKSNVLFERSQSRFSELEYIKGRDDWKDTYSHYEISEEMDSDNYHHLRRHSEAADTLEHIRGREDWIQNKLHHVCRNSLPRIFEFGETRIVIQDEIDSDEYHHDLLQNKTFCFPIESIEQQENLFKDRTYIVEYGEQSLVRSDSNVGVSSEAVNNKALEWSGHAKFSASREAPTIRQVDVSFNSKDQTEQDLITYENTHRDLEIFGLDLNPKSVPKQGKNMYNPFIVISEEPNNDVSENWIDAKLRGKQEKETDPQISDRNNRSFRAKSEKMDSINLSFLKPNEQKPRRSLSFENVEDLIRDVSSGPWFHK